MLQPTLCEQCLHLDTFRSCDLLCLMALASSSTVRSVSFLRLRIFPGVKAVIRPDSKHSGILARHRLSGSYELKWLFAYSIMCRSKLLSVVHVQSVLLSTVACRERLGGPLLAVSLCSREGWGQVRRVHCFWILSGCGANSDRCISSACLSAIDSRSEMHTVVCMSYNSMEIWACVQTGFIFSLPHRLTLG